MLIHQKNHQSNNLIQVILSYSNLKEVILLLFIGFYEMLKINIVFNWTKAAIS